MVMTYWTIEVIFQLTVGPIITFALRGTQCAFYTTYSFLIVIWKTHIENSYRELKGKPLHLLFNTPAAPDRIKERPATHLC